MLGKKKRINLHDFELSSIFLDDTQSTVTKEKQISWTSLKFKLLWSSLVAQQIKDTVFSLQHLGLLLWCRFDPWLRRSACCGNGPKIKFKKELLEGLALPLLNVCYITLKQRQCDDSIKTVIQTNVIESLEINSGYMLRQFAKVPVPFSGVRMVFSTTDTEETGQPAKNEVEPLPNIMHKKLTHNGSKT